MKDSNLYFIDTNIFLRVLIKENELAFNQSYKILELIKLGKIKAFTSSLVLAEINFVLGKIYKFTKAEILASLKSILNLKNLKISDKGNIAAGIFLYEHNNVKFIDSLIAENDIVLKNKAKIISYDKDFDDLVCRRIDPSQLLKMYE